MKRYVALALLAASLLAGCGTSPALTPAYDATSVSASGLKNGTKVQIFNAFKRVEANNQVRVVVMYWVRGAGNQREFRQVIVDSVATNDRVTYKSGYQPTHMVVNGADMLHDRSTLLKVIDEVGALAYHTTTEEQQRTVALAYELLRDRL